ncbi:MAG TPA: lipocalin-like domain-containing protein, partial [Chthoniobacterales bacterium]|nr:lipocalin-like domain-containing protein [Chthoniobacterales bacterium]
LLYLASVTLAAGFALAADWQIAEPGWRYESPRDHHAHLSFKTEWWYFTGNLSDATGRRFGYQLTFFRQGILPPDERKPELSRFVVRDLKFAHFTVTDVAARQFHFIQKTSRGAFGEAGFDEGDRLAWLDSWSLRLDEDGAFHLTAASADATIDLRLVSLKPPAVHGTGGLSRKASGEGHASHYYSLTRLGTEGQIRMGAEAFGVTGESWFDHEWATNQLSPQQVGWDWISLHLDDGTELMLYRMRLENREADASSSGTFIAADGTTTHLPLASFQMNPSAFWQSDATGAKYPIAWKIDVPEKGLHFSVRAVLQNQELALLPLAYWEGAIEMNGTRDGKPIKGRGYLELTGYAGPLRELQR